MQSDAFIDESSDIAFEIRYEGGDAVSHMIEMSALSESLDGFSRIYSVISHFVATGQYARQIQALSTKTYAVEPQAKCFNVPGWISMAASTGLFQGFAGIALTLIVSHVFKRNSSDKEEMKHLRELFEKQLGFGNGVTEKMLATIERLADALQPAVKKSVAPVGKTCTRIDLYAEGTIHQTIDAQLKHMILMDSEADLSSESEYLVRISEMDKIKKTCKVHFIDGVSDDVTDEDGSLERIIADITDPAIMLAQNAYIKSFASGSAVKIKAKALMKDGLITRLFISDAST
jgi:hypothetical protein